MDGTLLLRRRDVEALLDLDTAIAAVERALRLHADGRSLPPAVLGVPAGAGGFHVKAAGLALDRPYFAAKVNGNFPGNPRRGAPAIRGVVVLADAADGAPLAVIDSIALTAIRTGAATAVAARHLAPAEARTGTICGCGRQGEMQLRALARVRRLARVLAYDVDPARAEAFAARLGPALDLGVTPVRA